MVYILVVIEIGLPTNRKYAVIFVEIYRCDIPMDTAALAWILQMLHSRWRDSLSLYNPVTIGTNASDALSPIAKLGRLW